MQTDRQPATHCVGVCHSFYPAMMGGPNCDHDEVETYDLATLSPGDALKWRGEGGRWKPLVFVGADDDGIDIRMATASPISAMVAVITATPTAMTTAVLNFMYL